MDNKVREIIIRKYSGERRKDTRTPLYEIVEGEGKSFAHSERGLLIKFGSELSSGFFNEVKLINEIKDEMSSETLEGLEQIIRVNNNHYAEILSLRKIRESLQSRLTNYQERS